MVQSSLHGGTQVQPHRDPMSRVHQRRLPGIQVAVLITVVENNERVLQESGKGSHHLKKRYFMKQIHKMLTCPPGMGFVKSYLLVCFFCLKKRFCEIWQTRPPGL